MQDDPNHVEGTPPETDENDDHNPERQGPGGDDPGPADVPDPDKEGPSGPPPESLPGGPDEGPAPAQN